MIITKIQRLRSRRSRYGVYLDGSLALELSDLTIGKFGMRTGDELDEDAVGRIKSKEAEAQAKNIAINYISYRPRSSKEVLDHLTKKGFTRNCAEETVDHLRAINMIDDMNFAYTFVRDRLKRKQVGQILLRQQLLIRGITSAVTDKVLAELISAQSQQASAIKAAKSKLRSLRHSTRKIDADKQKKRILDFLLRRGYPFETALKTINSTLDR